MMHHAQNIAPTIAPSDPLRFANDSRDADVLPLVEAAVKAGRTRLAFQPVVHASDTKKVVFFEGLIRAMDEKGRVIPAAHFMPLVEETDLGRRIDAATLRLAFDMLRTNPRNRLSINVSARSLADNRWRKVLDAGLKEVGVLGNRLIFEISETSAMHLHEVLVVFMEDMQSEGVGFALDGFGAGMISLRRLNDFYFDMVKIDKGFARRVATNPDNQILSEALIMLAGHFDMVTVADGVESAADSKFFQSIGVDCLQGYHFGAPKFVKS